MSDNPLQHELDDELLSAYLDDELTDEERAAVEARLAADPAARQMLDELRHVSQAVRGLPRQSPPDNLRESILRQAAERDTAVKPAAAADSIDRLPKLTIGRTRRAWIWASLAVAAALLIMFFQQEDSDNANGPVVALRRREPASLTAPPAPSRSERRLSEELAATPEPRLGASAPEEASDAVSPEMIELYSDAPPEPTEEELDEQEFVVVHVLAKPEALQNKTFDQLLLSNGVAVEPDAPEGQVAPLAGQSRAASRDLAVPAAAVPPADQQAENVDVVLVDAPPTTIESCIADLNKDHANYLSVSIDETPASEDVARFRVTPTKKLAADLGKYNRGIVPQQQKDWLARDKAYYYQQSPDSGGFRGGLGGAADQGREIKFNDHFAEMKQGAANQARAKRVQISKSDDRSSPPISKLRHAVKPPAPSDDDNLHVLFVLAPSDESAAAGAAEPAASPAAENRPE